MIVTLNTLETSTIVVHMAVMRQNVRNGFKKNRGKKDGKQLLASYDEVKLALEAVVSNGEVSSDEKLLEEAQEVHEFHFNVQEIQTLSSFLNYYVPTLEGFLKKTGKIQEVDQLQLDTMIGIKTQLDELKELHKVG